MTLTRSVFATAVLVAICGCTSLEDDARAAVAQGMLDPAAAQFRSVRTFPADPATRQPRRVCGEYNAKNGYGAYTGFRVFRYTESRQLSVEADDDAMAGNDRLSAEHGCIQFGHDSAAM